MRTFSRFSSRKVGGMHHGRHPSTPHQGGDPTNYHLRQARDYLDTQLQYNPGRFETPEPPQETPEWDTWEGERDMWERGMRQTGQNAGLEQWIHDTISMQGLDVVLRMRPLPDGYDWFWDQHSEFWTSDDWNLIKVYTIPGPLFLTFIASDYQIHPAVQYHISIVYRKELWQWYEHLLSKYGENRA